MSLVGNADYRQAFATENGIIIVVVPVLVKVITMTAVMMQIKPFLGHASFKRKALKIWTSRPGQMIG